MPKIYSANIKNFLERLGLLQYSTALIYYIYNLSEMMASEKTITIQDTSARFYRETGPEFAQLFNLSGERKVIEDILSNLNEGDVFYDVGANIGLYTCLVSSKFPKVNTIAFEPLDSNFRRLSQNCMLNNLENVKIIEKAVGDYDGKTELFIDPEFGDTPGSGRNSLLADSEHKMETQVDVVSVDSILRENRKPTVLKIDVEGKELEVVDLFKGILKEDRFRRVYVEFHPRKESTRNTDREKIAHIIEEAGLETKWIEDEGKAHPYLCGYRD